MNKNPAITDWQRENRRKILQRLSWMHTKDDGIVIHHDDGEEEMIIVKRGDIIFLHFVGKNDETGEDVISDVMSLIDTRNPLVLHSRYAHAMLMSLAFVPNPQKIYMLGFGGGRIPMILHHYLADLSIEASELSPGVISLLEMCFGIGMDERMNVEEVDGRQHLESFPESSFDIIFLDTFSGAGEHPNRLSTLEFYRLCHSRLNANGVIATNLVDNNPYFKQKVDTFCTAFKFTYTFSYEENHVFIGSNDVNLDQSRIASRANQVDEQFPFNFKLADYVNQFTKYNCSDVDTQLLTDNSVNN